MLQFTKEHGDESYFTARIGKISPTIIRNYGNGLMASASTPLILTDVTLADNPFTPARESFGLDVGQRWRRVFVQAGVLNGEDVPGQAAVNDHKDFFASAELTADGQPTGVGVYYYRAGYDLGDPAVATLFDRYDRTSVFANYTRDKVRLAGAYAFGKDRVQTLAERKIRGFYVQPRGGGREPGAIGAPRGAVSPAGRRLGLPQGSRPSLACVATSMVVCGYVEGALGSVGVRDLRNNLSEYLRRVKQGELLVITDRGKPIGELGPAAGGGSAERARELVRKGVASWSGGKPKGLSQAPRPTAGLVSEAVIEDRR